MFKACRIKVLLATDIAARGIDIGAVSHGVNFELPNVPEQDVHRIGRTARAGAEGIALSFYADDERPYLRDIEKLTKVRLAQQPPPSGIRAARAAMPQFATERRDDRPRGDLPHSDRAHTRGDRPKRHAPKPYAPRPPGERTGKRTRA